MGEKIQPANPSFSEARFKQFYEGLRKDDNGLVAHDELVNSTLFDADLSKATEDAFATDQKKLHEIFVNCDTDKCETLNKEQVQ